MLVNGKQRIIAIVPEVDLSPRDVEQSSDNMSLPVHKQGFHNSQKALSHCAEQNRDAAAARMNREAVTYAY